MRTLRLIHDGQNFTLRQEDADNPTFGTVSIAYINNGDNSPRINAGASRDFHPRSVVPDQVYSLKH